MQLTELNDFDKTMPRFLGNGIQQPPYICTIPISNTVAQNIIVTPIKKEYFIDQVTHPLAQYWSSVQFAIYPQCQSSTLPSLTWQHYWLQSLQKQIKFNRPPLHRFHSTEWSSKYKEGQSFILFIVSNSIRNMSMPTMGCMQAIGAAASILYGSI